VDKGSVQGALGWRSKQVYPCIQEQLELKIALGCRGSMKGDRDERR
jgi:hypothetical protein